MKKILLILSLLIVSMSINSKVNGATIQEENKDNTWDIVYDYKELYDTNLTNTNIAFYEGWYIFNFDFLPTYELFNANFKLYEIQDDMHIPTLDYELAPLLLHIDQMGGAGLEASMLYRSKFYEMTDLQKGKPICFYSKEYPVDTVPPEILTTELKTYATHNESITDIIKRIIAVDSKDGVVSNNVAIIKETYTQDKTPGIKELYIQVHDAAGNVTTGKIDIIVVDDFYSTIIVNTIYTANTHQLTEEYILSTIVATDFYGRNFDIEIKDENYFENSKVSGEYTITVIGTDLFEDINEETFNIIVFNSNIPFYTHDIKTLYLSEYFDLSNEDLLFMLNIISDEELHYTSYKISSLIKREQGSHYVFFELYAEDYYEEIKLTIHFENVEEIEEDLEIEERVTDVSKYIIPAISSILLFSLIIHFIIVKIEK